MSRALAVASYLAADVVRGQRYLFPLLVQLGVLAILFGGDPGPPPAPWAVSALTIYPVSAWLAMVVAHTEAPEQRLVTAASAGGYGRLAAATAGVALVGGWALGAVSVLLPVVVSAHPHPPGVILLGLVAHLACAATGTAVGLLCAHPLIRKLGWSLVAAFTIVAVTAVQPWLPPVGAAVATLTGGGRLPLVELAVGLLLVVGVACLRTWVAPRRA